MNDCVRQCIMRGIASADDCLRQACASGVGDRTVLDLEARLPYDYEDRDCYGSFPLRRRRRAKVEMGGRQAPH